MLLWVIMPFVPFAAIPVQAQTTIVEKAAGGVSVIVDGEVTPVPSNLTAETRAAAGRAQYARRQ